jgi:16S rRNA (cytosine1402-N4)-methyltransferase
MPVTQHIPVLLDEVIEQLDPRPGDNFIDGTLGGGGHAEAILMRIGAGGSLIAADRDGDAIKMAKKRLSRFRNIKYLQTSFSKIKEKLKINELPHNNEFSGELLDLGLSLDQLKHSRKGFTFLEDQPLDMRYDSADKNTAADIVNSYNERTLTTIISDYGEERLARAIAREIISRRRQKKITSTGELSEIISSVYRRRGFRNRSINPATKTFQALRIVVNNEMEEIREALPGLVSLLKKNGRLAVIAFHSVEDRIIKDYFRQESRDCLCPPVQPTCTCAHKASLRIVTKKPIVPSRKEIIKNPASRSAKLRVAQKI